MIQDQKKGNESFKLPPNMALQGVYGKYAVVRETPEDEDAEFIYHVKILKLNGMKTSTKE